MKWLPATKVGRISFWMAVCGFAIVNIQYWIAMGLNISIPPLPGLLAVVLEIAGGIGSIIALVKYKDRVILLFLTSIIGLLGLMLVLGELLLPH
jgi:hypothetical protein